MTLTSEDREALGAACGWPGQEHSDLDVVVEQIVARHVTAALNDVANAIEVTCPPRRTDAAHGRLDAARIVRDHTPT